jgi:exodeoxyribonuclease VII large subunit
MLRVIKRRHPRMHILLYPVPVQGADAAPRIAEAIRFFNREQQVDVLILGRGGGSLEDLWAFNEEVVARAIYASRIPIISAVGHETDYTISDFVADLRAPTPSAAAEVVVQSEESFCAFIEALETGLARAMRQKVERYRSSLRELGRAISDPRRLLEEHFLRVDELTGRLSIGLSHHVRRDRARLDALTAGLTHLNPLSILSRGYSITQKLPQGGALKDAAELVPGDMIRTVLDRGQVLSRVEGTEISGKTS